MKRNQLELKQNIRHRFNRRIAPRTFIEVEARRAAFSGCNTFFMEHSSIECSFSHKIRTAALIAAPLLFSATASAEIVKHDIGLTASYMGGGGNSYLNYDPITGSSGKLGPYDLTHPLRMYFCGADNGSLYQTTSEARWAAVSNPVFEGEHGTAGSPTVFSEGDVIGSETTFLTNHNSLSYNSYVGFGGFTVDADVDQYLGFSYANGSDIHYGYIQFRITPNETELYGNIWPDPIITFIGAYVNTTPGESITIGGASIPEPASAALLFGAAAVGMIACRRSRRAAR
jgi:hypothetical protein